MVEKTKQQLYNSFPDNVDQLIEPVDMRNFVDSVELKYNDWTVVKPGQPFGNKFPDPSPGDGRIHVSPGSYWIINGQVTLTSPITCDTDPGDNRSVVFAGLTDAYVLDALQLDVSIENETFIEGAGVAGVEECNVQVQGLSVAVLATNSTVFDLSEGNTFVITNAIILGADLGSISDYKNVIINDSSFLGNITSGLVLSGSYNQIRIDGFFTTVPGDIVLTFDGAIDGSAATIDNFTISSTTNRATGGSGALFYFTDANITFGSIIGCVQGDDATIGFISGVDNTSVNVTFLGNRNIGNTVERGSKVAYQNADVTTNPGVNLWAVIQASGAVLGGNEIRFESFGDTGLRYIGKETFYGHVHLSISVRKASGGDVSHEFGLFLNGSPYEVSPGVLAAQEIIFDNLVRGFSLIVPITLDENDTIEPVIRSLSGSINTITQNLNLVAN